MKTDLIRFGLKTREAGMTYEEIKARWLEVERLGFDSAWLYDHISFPNCLEPWTTLPALAEATTNIRLGVMVTCNILRHPSLLAKMAATTDLISGGRLEFALGAGDDRKGNEMFGIPFAETRERIEMLDEALKVIKALWTEPEVSFAGKYYTLKGAILETKPSQKPHPPIWIGGIGEKLMLRIVAEHANFWTAPQYLHQDQWKNTPEDFARKREVLKQHCKAVNRDENEITKCWQGEVIIADKEDEVNSKLHEVLSATGLEALTRRIPFLEHKTLSIEEYKASRIVGTPEQCADKILHYADAGVTYFLTNFTEKTFEPVRLFAEKVIPLVRHK